MASLITTLLHHLPLFLILPQLAGAVLAPKINNQPALQPHASSTYIVHANHLAKPPHFATLGHWYSSMVATHSPLAAANSSHILYTYDTVMHGFAVQLTGDEARRMSDAVGVSSVHEDRLLHYMTTRTPAFLGLDPEFGAWRDTDFGDSIIIGIVDSGIWPESPSFSDRGLGPVRPSWRGKCVGTADFNASLCNNKLVGAKAFHAVHKAASPRDRYGHGTLVASTAAGSEVRDTGFHMFARGTARGVAPKAKIAMYSIGSSPSMSAAAAAIDAAVKDGVDIISLSLIEEVLHPFYEDTLSVATFGAERKGVFVVLAGGNYGPMASKMFNVAPWMTTVGAATMDRQFPASLTLGNGIVLLGQSLYPTKINHTTIYLLVESSCTLGDLTPEEIMGKMVVCTSRVPVDESKVREAGGAGLLLVDGNTLTRDGIFLSEKQMYTLPAVFLSHTDGEKLKAYMASSRYPTASFSIACKTVIGENRAPTVATFSSRGPNPIVPELLKPDIIAPGHNIVVASSGTYTMESGTSIACPHVAGVAALIKKKHPDWTPAMIRSALMTTTGTLDNTEREIIDNAVSEGRGITAATPFAAGAGHVRPQIALGPGLVYDAGERDYVDFLCALNYTAEQLRLFVPDFVRCTRTLVGGPAGLNYPSLVVVFDNRTTVSTLMRTLTKVSEESETYNVTVKAPEHVKVTVTPMILEFKERMERKSYTTEFRIESGGNQKEEWDFGHISWESEKHQVRSPVAFQWKN